MTQMTSPKVTMLRSTDPEWPQEITVAVLPFFHIYAMNGIMTIGLQVDQSNLFNIVLFLAF